MRNNSLSSVGYSSNLWSSEITQSATNVGGAEKANCIIDINRKKVEKMNIALLANSIN